MRFRPCIDIHDGKVKQIVGGTLSDIDGAVENFVAEENAAFFASLYKRRRLSGGHVILLNPITSPFYEATRQAALLALRTFPGGLQVGGGVTDENAAEWLEAGASHVICTSFVFRDGLIHYENLEKLTRAVGREHLVLDLSCAFLDGIPTIVTDRWQKYTNQPLTVALMEKLSAYCDEFLVHATDNEGKKQGANPALARLLSSYEGNKVTYAGGIGSLEHLKAFREYTGGKVDVTIGSALDLFGGSIPFEEVCSLSEE